MAEAEHFANKSFRNQIFIQLWNIQKKVKDHTLKSCFKLYFLYLVKELLVASDEFSEEQ